MAGANYQSEFTQSWGGLRLSALPSGESRILSYRRIYRSNPWVWSAVNTIARGGAGFPIRVSGIDTDGNHIPYRSDIPVARRGPMPAAMKLDSLLRHPAPFISRRRLVRRAFVDRLVYGNALWVKSLDDFGYIDELYSVPWREISVIAGRDTPIAGYRLMGSAQTFTWAQDEVVQFGEGDPETPIAPSPLESLQWTIALMDAMSRNVTAFFQNAARPSGVLKLGTMPDDRELSVMREQIKQLYSGNENAGVPLITSGDWSPMNTGFSYADVVELSKLSREEVATAYQVPPPIMGILDKAIKSNVEELREQFVRDVLGPHCAEFTDELDAQLVEPNPAWAGLTTHFDMSERLLPDIEALATTFKELKRVYTLNELRHMTGKPALDFEWADQPWMEPGSLPAGLAPQGATVNPDVGDDDEQILPGDDELPDDDSDDDD